MARTAAKKQTADVAADVFIATLDLPIGPRVDGYDPENVQSHGLTTRQAGALKSLTAGLRAAHARYFSRLAKTGDGLVVDKYADTIKYLLDRVADAQEAKEQTTDGQEETSGGADG